MKRNTLKTLLFVQALFTCTVLPAQALDGYYHTIEGKQKITLKTTLHNIIKAHTELTYKELWTAFEDTDAKPNGKVWDMYSDNPTGTTKYEFTFISGQCGNYNKEGDCYNREHSFPKSWFGGEVPPMYTDLFHLYPTDGWVNNKRGNDPFGEVSNPTWTSSNGSKLGTNSTSGYSGTVFEPNDAYKGDFARTYFYMVTRYEDKVAGWAGNAEAKPVLDGSSYPAFKQWAIDVLLKWHRNDPVSEKEINRNNVVYASYQHNRNPFIDYPELVEYIWGNKMNEAFYFSALDIDDVIEQSIEIYASEETIVVKAVRPVQYIHVYDVFGRLVATGTGEAKNQLAVAAGQFYIVKAGETIAKVYVK